MTATWRTVLACAAAIAVAGGADVSAKRKDDRLVMNNGDQIVGEIKKLQHGQLSFKADYQLDTTQLDWSKVRTLQSADEFLVVLRSGARITAVIELSATGLFTLTPPGAPSITAAWSDVIGFTPVETRFLAQLTGSVQSGFGYTSGNGQTQFSASGALGYQADRYSFDLSGNSTFSDQTDGARTSRNTASLTNQLDIRPQWFALGIGSLETSSQQDLDLRTTLGGSIGRWLHRSDRTEFLAFGGTVYTHEAYSAPPDPAQPGSQMTNNIEGVVGVDFTLFRFKTTDIESRLTVFPSFSTPGRVRLNYAPTLNLEIAHNLYWNFTLYENYDSQPPVNANKNDFGVTNSLGWRF